MSAPTRPAGLERPARPVTSRPKPADPIRSAEAALRLRQSQAYRAYVLARYEWLRLRAVGAGYFTPQGHTPLPLKSNEQLADIQAKTKTVAQWLKVNAPEEATEEADVPDGKEPKKFDIPPKARQVACDSCGAPMYFVQTGAGKTAPVNPDGTSHFATCPNAHAHRSKARTSSPSAAPTAPASDIAPHVRKLLDIATEVGLSHEKPHRVARLAKINTFLMINEREPVEGIKSIREDDFDLLKAGLQKRELRWP